MELANEFNNFLIILKIVICWLPVLFLALAVSNFLAEAFDYLFDGNSKDRRYR